MYCWKCGTQADEAAAFCAKCGAELSAQEAVVHPPAETPGLGLILPVNVSGWAMASGYLGLFAVLLIPAPFALLTGILALQDMKKNPGRAGKGRAVFGVVMGSLCSIGLLWLIAAMLAPK